MLFAKLLCMKKDMFLALVLVTFVAVTTFAHDNSETAEANRKRAETLWDQAIEAKGGRDRLHSIESMVISSVIDINSERMRTDTQTERLYAMPGKAWLYEFTEAFDVSMEATVINNERDLCLVTMAPVGRNESVPALSRCVPMTLSQRLIQDPVIYLMETKSVRPVPMRTRSEGKTDVVETQVGKLRVDFYLNRKTHLPFKLVTDEFFGDVRAPQPMRLVIRLEDYFDVDGIRMPRDVIREPISDSAFQRRDSERAKYKFNVKYNEEIFNHPISRKAKAGDWKLKSDWR